MIPTMENLKLLSDEELVKELERRTVRDGKRVWKNANIVNEIGRREALKRKPGDPGTEENPIMKNGKAFVYTKFNRLALWEDYEETNTPEKK